MARTMSSLRPRGSASASISVTKPCWYSRLASSWIVLVAVVISWGPHGRPLAPRAAILSARGASGLLSIPGRGGQRNQRLLRLEHLGPQAVAQQVGDAALALEEVGQGDLVEGAADPAFERAPQGAERAAVVVD